MRCEMRWYERDTFRRTRCRYQRYGKSVWRQADTCLYLRRGGPRRLAIRSTFVELTLTLWIMVELMVINGITVRRDRVHIFFHSQLDLASLNFNE
jgi:hypothetical protein